MFCKNCGKQFGDDSNFCPNCGAIANQPTQSNYIQPIYSKESSIPGIGFGTTAVVLGIIGVVTSFFNFFEIIDWVEDIKKISNGISLTVDSRGTVITTILSFIYINILTICFAVTGRKKGNFKEITNFGLILGIIGLVIRATSFIIAIVA